MSLVERIQDLCSSKNTTLIGLEREIGLGRGTIRNWDKNSPSVDKVQKVAEYFGESTDFLLFGFNKGEFTSLVNMVRYKRSTEEFAKITGLDEHYINRLCAGVEYTQPTINTVMRIAINNENDWLVDTQSLFKAAGYDLEEISERLLEDIPLSLLQHYQKQGMSGVEMAMAYAKHKDAEYKDAMQDNYEPETIAAHKEGEDWTEEELEAIERFKQFVKSQRKQQE